MSEIYSNVVKSFTYLSILIELSKGKKLTGYDILVHVRNFGLDVSPGTVYHQLGMLSRSGIIIPHDAFNVLTAERFSAGLFHINASLFLIYCIKS